MPQQKGWQVTKSAEELSITLLTPYRTSRSSTVQALLTMQYTDNAGLGKTLPNKIFQTNGNLRDETHLLLPQHVLCSEYLTVSH